MRRSRLGGLLPLDGPGQVSPVAPARSSGKVESLINATPAEWAYGRAFATSGRRAAQPLRRLRDSGRGHPNGAMNIDPPVQRLGRLEKKASRLHTSSLRASSGSMMGMPSRIG